MANLVPIDKRRQHTNETGLAALDLLFQSASAVADPTVLQALRDQIVNITQQLHQAQTPTAFPPTQDTLAPAPCHLPGGQSERPKGNSTDWSNIKTELAATLQNAAQARQQACDSAALAAKALHDVTARQAASPTQEGIGDAVQAATKLLEDTEAAANTCRDLETKATADVQAHKNSTHAAQYDRN
jgi:hypothetical protein